MILSLNKLRVKIKKTLPILTKFLSFIMDIILCKISHQKISNSCY